MCEAFDSEFRFMCYLEEKHGTCPHGTVRAVLGCRKCAAGDHTTHPDSCPFGKFGPNHSSVTKPVCTCPVLRNGAPACAPS